MTPQQDRILLMNINHFLRRALIVGVFFIPFIVLIVPGNMFFPFITGKNFTFRIIVEVLLGLYLALALRDSSYRPRFSWLLGSFAIFLAIIGLADLLGENPYKSFWSNFERMEGYITFLHLFAYFVIASVVFNTEKLWERLFQTSLVASVILAGYGLLQAFGVLAIHQGSSRVDASLGNSTYFAVYVVIHIFLAMFLFLKHREILGLKIFYGLSVLLNLFILYQTETRGAIIGFVGGIFLTALIIALFEKDDKRTKKIAVGGVIGIIVIVSLFITFRDSSFIKDSRTFGRLAGISLSDAYTNPRIPIWTLAFEGFKEKPILGWGQENFNYVFNKYYTPNLYPQEQWFDRSHNIILDWLIAGGILGLLGYLSLYFLSLFYIWKKGEFTFKEKAVLTGLFGAYFFHNIFVFDHLVSLILFVTLFSYLHSHSVRSRLGIPKPAKSPNLWLQKSALPAGIILSLGLVYFINWNAYSANLNLIKAITVSQKPEESIVFFKKALGYDAFGNQEIREQLMQYAMNIRNAQVPDSAKQEIAKLTVEEMKKMIEQAPNDPRHYLFFGSVLDAYGDPDDGEKYLTKALELSPKKQSIIFQLGTHYLNIGNKQKALELFKQAYDLEPNYPEAKLIYAMGAIYAGNNKLAEDLIGKEIVIDDRLLRAYADNKQFSKAADIIKAKIALNPGDIQTRLTLAALYYQAGQKSNAVSVIKEIIAQNPDFKTQGESFIKEIQAGGI